MKPKKLRKHWKNGEVFENGKLQDVSGLNKRHLRMRTCRFNKHKFDYSDHYNNSPFIHKYKDVANLDDESKLKYYQDMGLDFNLREVGDNKYKKLVISGGLEDIHHSYGLGYYDISIDYYKSHIDGLKYCRVYFETYDDGDYGGWSGFDKKKLAVRLTKKVADRFKDIHILPTQDELNSQFSDLSIQFYPE